MDSKRYVPRGAQLLTPYVAEMKAAVEKFKTEGAPNGPVEKSSMYCRRHAPQM